MKQEELITIMTFASRYPRLGREGQPEDVMDKFSPVGYVAWRFRNQYAYMHRLGGAKNVQHTLPASFLSSLCKSKSAGLVMRNICFPPLPPQSV